MKTIASTRPIGKEGLRVLVIDIGGSNIKVFISGQKRALQIPSGPHLTPQEMTEAVLREAGRNYDVVSIGYPGKVHSGIPQEDAPNLGKGWVKFNFAKAFGRPTRIINDAALQALGSYEGGKMLFLGLGTGLGSALILNGVVHAMELGDLPYKEGGSYADYVSKAAMKRLGRARWARHVWSAVRQLAKAIQPDYTVLGGGQSKWIRPLPAGVRAGDNSKAFLGGLRLWEDQSIICARENNK